jgi:DNA translocase stage III sporulation protein
MDWRNSNDDLTRQSEARREREGQRFENGIHDRGGFGGMRQGPGGDPLARMRGAQPDPFANRVGGGFPQRQSFGQPQGFPQQSQPPQHLSQHEDWMDKVFKVFTGLWKHLTSYVWPVLSESDDMFRSDYKLRKGLTAALLYYGAIGGFSFLFGLFTRFATAPGILISLVGGGVSGGLFLYKNSQNKEWGLVDDTPKEQNLSAVAPSPSEFGSPSNFMDDGFGTPQFTSSGDSMSNFGQSPRREVPNEFRNFGSSGGWVDEDEEPPFSKIQGFEPMERPKPNRFDELEDEEEENFPTKNKGISLESASAKDIWGIVDDSEDLEDEDNQEETEDNSSSSREELEHPKLEEVSEGAFTSDLVGGLVEPELVTRSLLLDKYLSILDGSSLKPDWSRDVPKDSVEFKQLETFLRDAQTGGVKGLSEMDWVNVESITERVSVFEIITDRPEKLKGKETLFAKEITELLKDQMKDYFGENVTTTAVGKGSRIAITIFKQTGTSFMLRDLIASSKDFFLDTKNELPVVFGADEYGEPILLDLAKHTGTIIAGMARTGKSVLATGIVNQMMALNSPRKVQVVAGDMKNKDSDWYQITLPHLRKFATGTKAIMDLLDWVVSEEAPRRKRLIGDQLKIQNYNANCSDESEQLPYLFVVLDEIISFAEKLDKDEKVTYKAYLSEILTAFPNVGIFLIFVPHQLHNDYFPKTASRMVGNRFAVKAGQPIQKTIWEDSYRLIDFPTTNTGDFAYTLAGSDEPKFGHAPLIMSMNGGKERLDKLYETQRKMWTKLYPEEAATSAYVTRLKNEQASQTLGKLGIYVSDTDFADEDSLRFPKSNISNVDFIQDI